MAAGAAVVAAPAAAPTAFETLRWTAPGAELAALSTQPPACLASGPQQAPLTLAGQALFDSPALLGGQAAKAGLSCASCHVNGRGNAHFLMAGVSAQPGTADVTSSFFSAARSNGRFDPVAIPDLAAPGKVSRDPDSRALEAFIRTLIVDEFAGQEPSAAMLAALGQYVRAVRPCADGHDQPVPRSIEDQFQRIGAALAGATTMARQGDEQAARALIAAARHQLGLISERFAGAALARERARLEKMSRALRPLAERVAAPEEFAAAAATWNAGFNAALVPRLRQKEPQSRYNVRNLGFVAPQRDNR